MNSDYVILVDDDNKKIGVEEKVIAHKENKLHRAFSLIVYDPVLDRMLLQKRATHKYHSPGLWSNACCSHPYKDIYFIKDEILERAKYEIGLEISQPLSSLENIGLYRYNAKVGDLFENEIDHLFLYCASSDSLFLNPNEDEVSEVKWKPVLQIIRDLDSNSSKYTAWFTGVFTHFLSYRENILND